MSWYDPTSWNLGNTVGGFLLGGPIGAVLGGSGQLDGILNSPDAGLEAERKRLLQQQAAASGAFADQAQQGYGQLGQLGQQNIAALQAQASGQNSVSAEQLRQALQQNLAQQQSMAAGASPRNAAAAARTAAIQSGRLGAGLAGQQAIAGLQERNQAQQQLASAIQGMRGQDLNAALGGRQTAVTGYGANNAGQPEPSSAEKYLPMVLGGLGLAAKSDRRTKTDIEDGDESANKMLDGLKAWEYRYKDEGRDGAGKRTGIMAQDLERAGVGHAVIDTPTGKVVHGAHLATANTAMLAALNTRLKKLEGRAA